jgi:hypothetical protein
VVKLLRPHYIQIGASALGAHNAVDAHHRRVILTEYQVRRLRPKIDGVSFTALWTHRADAPRPRDHDADPAQGPVVPAVSAPGLPAWIERTDRLTILRAAWHIVREHRLPIILPPDRVDAWLDPGLTEPDDIYLTPA